MSDLIAILQAEVKRYFAIQWSHLGDSISWLLYAFLVFIAAVVILNGVSGGTLGQEDQFLIMVGWLTWVVASDCMAELPHIISSEAQTGTLEQINLIPLPMVGILALRSIAYLLGTGSKGIVAVVIMLFFVTPLSQNNAPALIILFLISLLGAYGLGFLFAGMATIYKRTESLTTLVFSLMIFLTGSLVGLESLGGIFDVLRFVFPLTWGISLMRSVMVGDLTLASLYQSSALIGLILHSITYLALGLLIFAWGNRTARVKGTLAHY